VTATPVSSSNEIAAESGNLAPHAARDRAPDRTRRFVAVVLLLLLATWLRFRDLDRQSLWFDEGVTAWIAAKPLPELIEAVKLWENTPPLHYLVVAGAIRVFGDTDFVVRFPSALAGVGCVWLTYVIGAYLFDWRVGIAAGVWMAISPFQILFAQEARAYMLMEFAALVSCYCFLRLLDGAPGKWWKLGYVVATSLLLWSQLYGVFVPVAQNLYYLGLLALRRRPKPAVKWWVVMQVVIALSFAPWLGPAYWWTRRVSDTFWIDPLTAHDITRSFWGYVGSGPMMVAMACLAALALYLTRNRRGATFCLLLALCPVVVPVVVSMLTSPLYTPRYGIIATVGFCLLAAEGIASLRLPALQVGVFLMLTALPLLRIDPPPEGTQDRAQWRQAFADLEPRLRRGDYVALNTGGGIVLFERYVKRRDVEVTGFTDANVPVPNKRRPGSRVWLVLHTPQTPPRDILASGNWRVVARRKFIEVDIWQLERGSEPPRAISRAINGPIPTTVSSAPSGVEKP
jgi:hypothetical protein